MDITELFYRFADAFEATLEDDNWSRLETFLADDATYLNVGGPDQKAEGREAIIAYLKADVANNDRRFDTRNLVALTPPVIEGNRLSRRWRCTYTLSGKPDLVVEGEARYLFDNGLITQIEEEVTRDSMHNIEEWMERYGNSLLD